MNGIFRAAGLCAVLAASGVPRTASGQDSSSINTTRLAVVGGVTAGTIVAVHLYQQAAWWQGQEEPFRFENDWTYALNIDKWGHMYGGYLAANIGRGALRWSGVNEKASLFYGSVAGLAYELYVEVEDGFHKAYGFSPGDGFSDILGASIPLAQSAFPILRNFTMKWSYYPSSQYLTDLQKEKFRVFIDDYEGQVYWIGMDPHFLLGQSSLAGIPAWLGLAFGAGVHNLDEHGGGERLYYLTLDYNFSRIVTSSEFLKTLFGVLDFVHWPAPGVGIENGRFRAGIIYTYNAELLF